MPARRRPRYCGRQGPCRHDRARRRQRPVLLAAKHPAKRKNSIARRTRCNAARPACCKAVPGSYENTMHEPAWWNLRIFVKTLPVKPEAATLTVFEAKIIACRSDRLLRDEFQAAAFVVLLLFILLSGDEVIFPPPLTADTLRPFGAHDAVDGAPPAKTQRRSFGQFSCRHIDRLGQAKKPDRPFRLDKRHGVFRRPRQRLCKRHQGDGAFR